MRVPRDKEREAMRHIAGALGVADGR